MVNLETNYLGLSLKNPLIVSASPLSDTPSKARQLEDAGAAAIVLHSLFEEQITRTHYGRDYLSRDSDPEETYFPNPFDNIYILSPSGYLNYIRHLKEILQIPVIGSLNGFTPEGWIRYARLIEQAGADALELNMYFIATDPNISSQDIEAQYVSLVSKIRQTITIPLAVKISPYYSALSNMAQQLVTAGANALVLFNRFYQPDVNLETMRIQPNLQLSSSAELRLRLRWVAMLVPNLKADLAITGGVHTAEDVLKGLVVGAKVTMMTSALMKYGMGHLETVLADMASWLIAHGYTSLRAIQGCLSQTAVTDPDALARANYLQVLRSST